MSTSSALFLAGITNQQAQILANQAARHAEQRRATLSLQLQAVWTPARRLSVGDARIGTGPVPRPVHDYASGWITMAMSTDPAYYIDALRSFAMRYTARLRKLDADVPADVVPDANGMTHLVPRWHHVAACGCKGPWINVGEEVNDGVTCSGCVKTTKPKRPSPRPKSSRQSA
jgi:hypothetical protein